MSDSVHNPAHYATGGIETIDFIRAKLGPEGFRAYCLGNVLKYVSRHAHKNGDEDLRKAGVYLDWAVESVPSPPEPRTVEVPVYAGVPFDAPEVFDDEVPLNHGTALGDKL